jgi:hypothetical protein
MNPPPAPTPTAAPVSAQGNSSESLSAPSAAVKMADPVPVDADDASPPSGGPRAGFLDAIKGMSISSLRSVTRLSAAELSGNCTEADSIESCLLLIE